MKIFNLMINRYHNILFLLVIIILGCEKDDICIEGSENTSRITIGFIDYENKGDKEINLNSIRGIGLDSILKGFNGNNLKLPLMSNTNKTKYVFEYKYFLKKILFIRSKLYLYIYI